MGNAEFKVVIMGMGYIGLPTAALIAKNNIKALGVDVKQEVVDTINEGKIHIVEPALSGLVSAMVERNMLKAAAKPETANVFLITVPTPFKGDHEPDISFVENATRMVIPCLKQNDLFIIESTSPVGTTEKMAELIYRERPELAEQIYIAYCPERVMPGNIIYELEHNDRVIGGIDDNSTQRACEFYSRFVHAKLHRTNSRTAEMCKLVENSYRDVNIAFANELSVICEKAGINVFELTSLANRHPRVNILKPGAGVGGHCIAVDPWFIVNDFQQESKIIRTAREINNYKSLWVVERINNESLAFEKQHAQKPVIACMGLAFKPNIDDLRESPALFITRELMNRNEQILAVEPNLREYPEIQLTNYKEATEKADILAFLVAHNEFKTLDYQKESKIVLDFCGINNRH